MSSPPVLLTVCLGNICRSPTAAAALEEAAQAAGVAIEVRSAGTGGYHVGAPPDDRMRAAGDDVGLRIDGAAAQVDADAIARADLVLAMDRSNLRHLQAIAADHGLDTPLVLFRRFDPATEDPDAEVPDPYYGGPQGFTEVVAMCRRTAGALIDRLDDVLAGDLSA
ncbi:MAG: low molecular weight phosphotyrosine protein phosphatase [Nitriliruptoraceae bacterium]|nr:low molecular weight phosphotyrosine protein phosphatase [Nitriliruptoraceae bacterium]